MDEPEPLSSEFSKLSKYMILGGISLVTIVMLITIFEAILQIYSDNLNRSTAFISISSGFATVLLLTVTCWYAYETNRLVRLRQYERDRESDELRVALSREIGSLKGFKKSAENVNIWLDNAESIGSFGERTVYKQNADKLGRLTPEEVDAVVSYYTHLNHMEQLVKAHQDDGIDATTSISDSLRTLDRNQRESIELMRENYENEDKHRFDIEYYEGDVGKQTVIEN